MGKMLDMSVISGLFNKIWQGIINFLPGSPFKALVSSFSNIPYLNYLNWFVPVAEICAVLEAWLAVVAIYYVYSGLMRIIRII